MERRRDGEKEGWTDGQMERRGDGREREREAECASETK